MTKNVIKGAGIQIERGKLGYIFSVIWVIFILPTNTPIELFSNVQI